METEYVRRADIINTFQIWRTDLTQQIGENIEFPHIRSDLKVCRTQLDDCIHAVRDIPAADVVEVVRCKDCYAYQRYPHLAEAAGLNPAEYCALLRCEFGPDGFCSYGRRADNG